MQAHELPLTPLEAPLCPHCQGALPPETAPLTTLDCPHCGKSLLMPGMLEGKYRIWRLLGKGGMGAVYEGLDEALQRKVAVKVILPDSSTDPEAVTGFIRESRTVAGLQHENTVKVYTAPMEGAAVPYLVMEFLDSGSLDKLMADGPVTPLTVLTVGEQIARGLQAAAAKGLVHGDVKPENILFGLDDTNKRVAKLADFGIAALAGAQAAAKNEVWGTPYYIAPETLMKQPIDFRADMYSLGATLYHAIAGVPPFEGADAAEVMRGRLTGAARPLCEVAPGCPESLSKVIMRTLEREPSHRYPNYDALVKAMEKERQALKSRVGGGKKIQIKGKVASTTTSMPSMPMPTATNLNAPLVPPSPFQKYKKHILFGGIGAGVLLILVIVLCVALGGGSDAPAADSGAAAAEVANAKAAQAAKAQAKAARAELKKLAEAAAELSTQAKSRADSAQKILKTLAQQAKRGVSEEHLSWLEPQEGEAPTALLKALQEAFAKREALQAAAKETEELRKKLDGLTETEGTPAALATALDEARQAMEAHAKAPTTTEAAAHEKALNSLRRNWKRLVDDARTEMERAAKARLEEERAARRKAAEEAEAERKRQAVEEEVTSVANLEAAASPDLDRLMPEAAIATFKARTTRLQSEEAKAAAAKALERLEAYNRLKVWMIAEAKAGELKPYGITAATPEGLTLSGKNLSWRDFAADRQPVFFRVLQGRLLDDRGARPLGVQKRAELATSARLYITRYFGAGALEKSKALRDAMETLQALADVLPGTAAERARVEGSASAE